MADIIGRASLGHFPQNTIANDLATRLGGFSTDFLVAAFHERDYVILLPQWVRPDDLINIGLVHLNHCRLRCFPWDPLRNATPSRLTYKAWIKLINLPLECWSVHRVSAILSGFGRFIKADANSINMVDLIGFRCLLAVDDLADIPDNLDITLGDVTVSMHVQIESSAHFGGDDRGSTFVGGNPSEGGVQTDPLGRRIARRLPIFAADGGDSSSREVNRAGHDPTWDSSDIRDRRRASAAGDRYSKRGETGAGAATSPPRSGLVRWVPRALPRLRSLYRRSQRRGPTVRVGGGARLPRRLLPPDRWRPRSTPRSLLQACWFPRPAL